MCLNFSVLDVRMYLAEIGKFCHIQNMNIAFERSFSKQIVELDPSYDICEPLSKRKQGRIRP